jgi:hypothetical protein
MSTTTLLTVVLFSLLGLFILALVAWSIHSRRQEEDGSNVVSPPPARVQQTRVEVVPTASAPSSVVGKILQNLVPDFAELGEISTRLSEKEAQTGRPLSKEEKRQTLLDTLDELSRRHPDNMMLRQMREGLPGAQITGAEGVSEDQIRLENLGTQTVIHVDGITYTGVDDIPDPSVRDRVRRLLDGMDRTNG